ncbi:hypothetical protein NC651_020378 [Populus alba x Populus x berolinensis]|nr:hypothetical protein NC651_020378 [Populus alba x Populus x berolinensis]
MRTSQEDITETHQNIINKHIKLRKQMKYKNHTCWALFQSSIPSLTMVAPTTTIRGKIALTAVKGARGVKARIPTTKK